MSVGRPLAALAATALLASLGLAGCGEDEGGSRTSRLVEPLSRSFPYAINAMEVLADGEILLSTNTGLYRLAPGAEREAPIEARVRAGGSGARLGKFLIFATDDGRRLVGSGHPDRPNRSVPEFLGLVRSTDGGRSWRAVSRIGMADMHTIRLAHGRIYAFDSVLGGMLISRDGGRTWAERATPPGLVIDLAVSPDDPRHIVAAGERALHRSTDGGRTWRPLGPARKPRLTWPAQDLLLRADRDGQVRRSDDGGESWRPAGRLDGEPWKLDAPDPQTVYAALADATVQVSGDGGESWRTRFRP